MQPTDLDGNPYTPAYPRPFLGKPGTRAEFAEIFDCDPAEIEYRLDARDRMNARAAERREYDDPYGYERGRRW